MRKTMTQRVYQDLRCHSLSYGRHVDNYVLTPAAKAVCMNLISTHHAPELRSYLLDISLLSAAAVIQPLN